MLITSFKDSLMGYGIPNWHLLISCGIFTMPLQSLLSGIWRGHTPSLEVFLILYITPESEVYQSGSFSICLAKQSLTFVKLQVTVFYPSLVKSCLVYYLSSTLLTIPVSIYLTTIFFYSCTKVILFIFLISFYSSNKYHNSYRAVFEKAQTLTEWATLNLLAPFLLRTLLAIGNKFQ